MTNVLTPNAKQQFFDNNGRPAAGFKLFTYIPGTTTQRTTYQDNGLSTVNSNPIILDYRGEANVWLQPNLGYKFVFSPPTDTDPPTNPIWTVDNIRGSEILTLYGGVDTGAANAYVLTFAANFTGYADGLVLYWVPSSTNTSVSTLNVNGLGAAAIVDAQGAGITAGTIVANQITAVIFKSGQWVLLNAVSTISSFTGTLTGMVAATTGTVIYKISGTLCTLTGGGINITGTSNTTAMTMTGLPTAVRPGATRTVPCAALSDNGNTVAGIASVSPAGVVTFRVATVSGAQVVPGNFTNAGVKGVLGDWSITYPLGS